MWEAYYVAHDFGLMLFDGVGVCFYKFVGQLLFNGVGVPALASCQRLLLQGVGVRFLDGGVI